MPRQAGTGPRTASLRDFSGGWNAADEDHNLSRKFQTLSDNCVVGVDNALSPRYGCKLKADPKLGVETHFSNFAVTIQSTISSPILRINWAGHGLVSGMHLTLTSLSATIPSIPSQPLGVYGILVGDANTIYICLRDNATATAGPTAVLLTGSYDTHMLGGNILDGTYFQGYNIIFTDMGEIFALDDNRVFTRIWDFSKAYATAGNPAGWRMGTGEAVLKHVSYDTFKQTLLVVNGRSNDKPVEIDMTRATPCQFLVDPATSSNAFVYAAEFVQCYGSYTLLYGSNNTATPTTSTVTTLDISAKGTSGVFVGNPAPDDAVQIDLGRITQTIEPRITGVSNIRNKVFVSFYDSAMLGSLNVFTTGGTHDPDFDDQVPQHGSINHRVLANLGNDLFMCDYAGVPAFTQSYQSGSIVPERVSELISPVLNSHLGRLNSDTLRYKAFAVYNLRDRQYMLFLPKFDSASEFYGVDDPLTSVADLTQSNTILVHAPNHTVNAGDSVVVSGAVSYAGLDATNINGTRTVVGRVDDDYFLMEVGTQPVVGGASGGGSVVHFAPVNDENIGYVFTLNPQLKIKRWTRYRNLLYTAGWTTRDGRVFFVQNNKIVQHGTKDAPIYADNEDDYDFSSYAAGHAYAVGDRVYNSADGLVYQVQIAYTSVDASFVTEIAVNPTYWSVYDGDAINFAAETPWSDNDDHLVTKFNSHIRVDSKGTDQFTLSAFVDDIYLDPTTLALSPKLEIELSGGDTGGYGGGSQNYGGGVRTKEKQLIGFPMRYTIVKLRIAGASTRKLSISGIHLLYKKGNAWR